MELPTVENERIEASSEKRDNVTLPQSVDVPRHRPKVQGAVERLAHLARTLGPGAKMPTVVELRRDLGVSLGTLDTALREAEARGILARRQGSGIWVCPRANAPIALICHPSFFSTAGLSPFWQLLVEHTQARAQAEHERVAWHFASDETSNGGDVAGLQHGLAEEIRTGAIRGALGVGLHEETAQWIEEHEVPIVAFAGPGTVTVSLDSETLLRLGVESLKRQGCRRIGMWCGVATSRPAENIEAHEVRLSAQWRQILSEHDLAFDAALLQLNHHWLNNSTRSTNIGPQEQGYATAQSVFAPAVPPELRPDGVVIMDDMMTRGALTALRNASVKVGIGAGELKIATHANTSSPVLMGREADLWRMEYDVSAMAQSMFAALEALMSGQSVPAEIVLAPRLLEPENFES